MSCLSLPGEMVRVGVSGPGLQMRNGEAGRRAGTGQGALQVLGREEGDGGTAFMGSPVIAKSSGHRFSVRE